MSDASKPLNGEIQSDHGHSAANTDAAVPSSWACSAESSRPPATWCISAYPTSKRIASTGRSGLGRVAHQRAAEQLQPLAAPTSRELGRAPGAVSRALPRVGAAGICRGVAGVRPRARRPAGRTARYPGRRGGRRGAPRRAARRRADRRRVVLGPARDLSGRRARSRPAHAGDRGRSSVDPDDAEQPARDGRSPRRAARPLRELARSEAYVRAIAAYNAGPAPSTGTTVSHRIAKRG